MSRMMPVVLIALMTTLALTLKLPAQQPHDSSARMLNARLQIIEAEFQVRMMELELKMAELAENEAAAEVEKIQQHINLINNSAGGHMGTAVAEKAQATIRLKQRATQIKMAELRLTRAKSRLAAIKNLQDQPEEKPTAVRLEYVEGSDVVVIRGPKESVEKVRTLIEEGNKQAK